MEFELVQVCVNEGIGILPWSPLGGGWLTGNYRRDRAPAGTTRLGEDPERGMEAYGRRNPEERTWRVIEAVRSVAEARGVSMAQVALAWLVDRPAVTSVILGARTLEQLEDNLGAAGLHLSASETARLDEASTPIVDDYPYGEFGVSQRDRGLPVPGPPRRLHSARYRGRSGTSLDGPDPCRRRRPTEQWAGPSWEVTSHRIGAARLDRRLGEHNLEERPGTRGVR